MIYVVVLVSVIVLLVALHNWRQGILALLVIGLIQDPIRKLTHGAPASFILWSAAIFGAIIIIAWFNRAITNTRPLNLGSPEVGSAWMLFFILIVLQVFNTFFRWGSPPLVILGLMFYLAPVLALLVSTAYANSFRQVDRFMKFYVWLMVPAVLTVYLSPAYSDAWPVLRDVGTFSGQALIIYDVGKALMSHPGIFRVGEMAAWHGAMAACFLIILTHKHPSTMFKVLVATLIVLIVGAIVLTGRRKMIMALSVFVVAQWGLIAFYGKGGGRKALGVMFLGLVGSLAFLLLDEAEGSSEYFQRGTTVFGDVGERLLLSYDLMMAAFHRSQWIGLGAGVTSQGARFVGMASDAGGAAEAGTGKILVELGLPGMLICLWLMFVLARRLLTIFRQLAQSDETLFYYAVSFFAMIVANVMTFVVATQIYSDPFVLIVLGMIAGFLFAICRVGTMKVSRVVELSPGVLMPVNRRT